MFFDILIVLIFAAVITYILSNKTLNVYIKIICMLIYSAVTFGMIGRIVFKYLTG